MFVVGVDGCRDGWIAVALTTGRFAGASMHERFADLLDEVDDAYAIGIDIPIGLLESGVRRCDEGVRERLGPRASSLFTVPPRPAIEAESYEQANALSRELCGRGLSTQAYNLRPKILEVDAALRDRRERDRGLRPYFSSRELNGQRPSNSSLGKYARIIEPDHERQRRLEAARPGGRIIEVHPEASFAALAGGPLSHDKRSYNGVMVRLRLLERAGIRIPLELDEIGGVQVDDVLDAAVVAWSTHRYAMQRAEPTPPPEQWQRDGDRVIAIWT